VENYDANGSVLKWYDSTSVCADSTCVGDDYVDCPGAAEALGGAGVALLSPAAAQLVDAGADQCAGAAAEFARTTGNGD
jgi:hypothetical protein